jgi:hypothetical protein
LPVKHPTEVAGLLQDRLAWTTRTAGVK